jgi:lipopolysaccharide export system protein LptA
MRRHPELAAALAVVLLAGGAAAEPDAAPNPLFDAKTFAGRKDPIVVTSDKLEYDYKGNVVVYRGDVLAVQGEVKVKSETLTVTFASTGSGDGKGGSPSGGVGGGAASARLEQIVAAGNVRIDHGTRWATGGRAVFDQRARTFVLTESPVMHDGSNEVAGDRVVVYLDENRSVVEGGRRRVKAVLYPGKDDGLVPAENRRPPSERGADASTARAEPPSRPAAP